MKPLFNMIWKLRIWKDTHAQDLIEYALMAGFVAVAAGAIMPGALPMLAVFRACRCCMFKNWKLFYTN